MQRQNEEVVEVEGWAGNVEGEEEEEIVEDEVEKKVVQVERRNVIVEEVEGDGKREGKKVEDMLKEVPARSALLKEKGRGKRVQFGTVCTRLFEWCQGYETVPSDKRSPSVAMRYWHHLMVTEDLINNEAFAETSVGADGRRVEQRLDYMGWEDRSSLLEFVGAEMEEDREMEMVAASRSRGCRCGGRCRMAVCECRRAGVECWDWCQCGTPTFCDNCAADPNAGCSQHHSLRCGNVREERREWKREQRVAHDRERLLRLMDMEEDEGRLFFEEEELREFEPVPNPVGTIGLDEEEEESAEWVEDEGEEVEGGEEGEDQEDQDGYEGGEEEDREDESYEGRSDQNGMDVVEREEEVVEMEDEVEENEVAEAMEAELPEDDEDSWVEGESGSDDGDQRVVRMVVRPRYEVWDEDGEVIGHMQWFEEDMEEEVVEEDGQELEGEELERNEPAGSGEEDEDEQEVERVEFVPVYMSWEDMVIEEMSRLTIRDEEDGEDVLETTRSTATLDSAIDQAILDDIVGMDVDLVNDGRGRDADEESVSSTSTAIPLRRSTRIRRPVDRFTIPIHVPKRRGKRAGGVQKKRRTRRRVKRAPVPVPPPVPQPPRQPPFQVRTHPVPAGPPPVTVDVAAKVMTLAEAGAELAACRKFFEAKNYGFAGMDVLLKLKRSETTWRRICSPNVHVTPPMERKFIATVVAIRAMMGKAD